MKPINVFFFNKKEHDLKSILKKAQEKMLERNDANGVRNYHPGEYIYEKIIGQRNKLLPRFKRQKVKEDLGNKIKIHFRDRIIHKDNIRT